MTLLFNQGTITATNGSSAITFVDAELLPMQAQHGDEIVIGTYSGFFDTVDHENQTATIMPAYTGTTGADKAYAIRRATPLSVVASEVLERTFELIKELSVFDAEGVNMLYRFSTGVAGLPLKDHYIAINNANANNATSLTISVKDGKDKIVGPLIASWRVGTYVLFRSLESGSYYSFRVTSVPTIANQTATISVEHISHDGFFANNEYVVVGFAMGADYEYVEGNTAEMEAKLVAAQLAADDAADKASQAADSETVASDKASQAADSETVATTKANEAIAAIDIVVPAKELVVSTAAEVNENANRAEAASAASFLNSATYLTEPTGRAAVADGAQFSSISSDLLYVERRSKVDSTRSTVINKFPTAALFNSAIEYLSDPNVVLTPPSNAALDTGEVVAATLFGDEAGYVPAYITTLGTLIIEKLRPKTIDYRGGMISTTYPESNYSFAVVDENDNVLLGLSPERGLEVSGVTSESSSSLRTSDLANKQAAELLQSRTIFGLQQSRCSYNLIMVYGQSLAEGQEAWPAITKAQLFGNLMLGLDTRPTGRDGTTFVPKGTNTFQPLIPRVISSTGVLLTDAEVAALPPGDSAPGEDMGVGLANMASLMISRLTYADAKPFVVMNAAVAGKSIEQLSKINTEDSTLRYGRFTGAVDAFVTAAGAQTKACTATLYVQGENDYVSTTGTLKATKPLYRGALDQMLINTTADIKSRIGQTDDPLFLIYQTGGGYARDVDVNGVPGLHVGMAQLEFALANPKRVGMFSPVYPVTDKGGHLDSNGERWLAMQAAKVYKRMVVDGKEWRPLSPRRIEVVDSKTIRIHFHVPQGPLNFAPVYNASVATLFTNRGFRISDSAGVDKTLASVSIVADTIVEIKTTATMDMTTALIWYASKTTYQGQGNLRDSDGTMASEVYQYLPDSGMYAAANIPALVGNPYPLNNWCVAFCLPTTYTEN